MEDIKDNKPVKKREDKEKRKKKKANKHVFKADSSLLCSSEDAKVRLQKQIEFYFSDPKTPKPRYAKNKYKSKYLS